MSVRMVTDDNNFETPTRYRQPLRFYLKMCGCLTSNESLVIAAFKRQIITWDHCANTIKR